MPKVIIVGAGIVGPVMAIMLKRKGYDPIIVERVQEIEPVGLSLALWPNGLKVLSTIGQAHTPRAWREGLEFTSDGEHLGGFDQSYFRERYGFPSFGVRRAELRHKLVDCAVQEGITVHEDWELAEIRELDYGVLAIAKDGREIEASFIVGCDGLHSATRKWICTKHGVAEPTPDYTGLVTVSVLPWTTTQALILQIGGFCPTSGDLPPASPCGWYGDGKYIVTYEVDDTTSVWALTMAGEDRRERWRDAEDVEREKVKILKDLEDWPAVIREMVASTDSILGKIGLYDRPSLLPEHWYHGRCVLVGDAAHPTSPHLGQGANQGLEDCWCLSQMLPDANGEEDLDVVALGKAFQRYAEQRQPRTAALVQGARAMGQLRVVSGEEACKQRNETMREMYADKAAVMARLDNLYSEPF
ncbi:hypothetical protein H2200_011741 [Cladophialophora chaetospira]|uniref:FAD-binding domain-containing protein n=1 Tax=Cladophialophora chaetospira TaxID=386627 RepID=A0AA38WYM7_9EURO|nr:hypothetical protein H2200_011741 [Cladophialophora chaetospira]